MTSHPAGWTILAIGGSSGTGKTLAAQRAAKHFGVSMLLVDDIRLALQQMTTSKEQPELHFFSSLEEQGRWEDTPEHMRDGFITVGKAIAPALETIMAHHIVVSEVGPLILEGDAILPQTVASPRFSELKQFYGLRLTNEVRAVFLYEADQQAILHNMLARVALFKTYHLNSSISLHMRAGFLASGCGGKRGIITCQSLPLVPGKHCSSVSWR